MSNHGLGLVYKVEGHINQHCYCELLEQNVYRTIQKFHLDSFCFIFQLTQLKDKAEKGIIYHL